MQYLLCSMSRSGVAGFVLLLSLLLAAAALSLIWWRADLLLCACEYCPDGHCGYAERIHSALFSGRAAAWGRLHVFAENYLHAQIPLAAVLVAIAMVPLQSSLLGFVVVSALATWLAWVAVLRIVRSSWDLDRTTLLLLAVAFWTDAIVVRGFARPLTDSVGMACCAWALWAIGEHVARRERATALRVVVLQLVGLASRVSFLPMLGMPVVAELAAHGSPAERVRRAIHAGIVFGALPALVVAATLQLLAIDHTLTIWRWAHAERFAPSDPGSQLLAALVAAGGVYLLVGLIGGARIAATAPVWRLHLAWIALYVSFLVIGGGALWLRYFAPIVPSVFVVAAPGLVAIARQRPALACALVAAAALLGWRTVLTHIDDPAAVVAVLRQDAAAGGVPRPLREPQAPVRQKTIALSANHAADQVDAAADGDLATMWRTSGPQDVGTYLAIDLGRPRPIAMLRLLGAWGEAPREFVLEASDDGVLWHEIDARREVTEIRSAEATVLRFAQRSRYFRVRLVASAPSPWSVSEVQLFVRQTKRTAP